MKSAFCLFACGLVIGLHVPASHAADQSGSPRPVVQENFQRLIATNSCPSCDLAGAILNRLDLSGANLEGANLAGAKLYLVDLSGANLQNANLQAAGLGGADLAGADLRGANLTGVILEGAYLTGAQMDGKIVKQVSSAKDPFASAGEKVFVDAETRSKNMPYTQDLVVEDRHDSEEMPPAVTVLPDAHSKALPVMADLKLPPAVGQEDAEPADQNSAADIALDETRISKKAVERVEEVDKDTTVLTARPKVTPQIAREVARNIPAAEETAADQALNVEEEPIASQDVPQEDEGVVPVENSPVNAVSAPEQPAEQPALSREIVSTGSEKEMISEIVDADEKSEDAVEATGKIDQAGSGMQYNVVTVEEADQLREQRIGMLIEKKRCVECDLNGADLSGRDLEGFDLERTSLQGSKLQKADLRKANLKKADLRGADLRGADLRGADLYSADLSGADVTGARLEGALLDSVDLTGTVGLPKAASVPEE